MSRLSELSARLRALDGRGYKAYRSVEGAYSAEGFTLIIDRAQGDPYADPSRLRARLDTSQAALPDWTISSKHRRVATADYLNRVLYQALRRRSRPRGSGTSGELRILEPGQQVLERASMIVTEDGAIEARFRAGLPARGRRIDGPAADELLTHEVVPAIREALPFPALDSAALRRHVETLEDAAELRAALEPNGLVAFIAEGAVLPRRSGLDDRPLERDRAVPFRPPEALRNTLETPNSGPITGLGIPEGVTLIVGGGFHGKSTLLRAIEHGVYDHIPGDGRERVVARSDLVKVRAEDGRSIAGTDISAYIGNLPGGADTRRMRTSNASGSTSQAAAIAEALEVGAGGLLIDEDTSATNFLIRDARMQRLIETEAEPITPLIDHVRSMAANGISTILVVGGSGDYFDVADTVIAMRDYTPTIVTDEARAIAAQFPTARTPEAAAWRPPARRVPLPASLDPARGHKPVAIKAWGEDRLMYGTGEIDLRAVEQIVERAQTRAMAEAIAQARGREIDGVRDLADALRAILDRIDREGIDTIQPETTPYGEYTVFRIHELAALLNRIRSLEVIAEADSAPDSLPASNR